MQFSYRAVFFIGWLLSPFTFWNDAFVNIPISYLAASFLSHFIRVSFGGLVVGCYWMSNFAGLAMMYASGKDMVRQGKDIRREIAGLIAAIAVYSAALLLLVRMGVLKPI